jgi:hypothetical protein
MRTLDKQIGGSHYTKQKIQPIQGYALIGIEKQAFMSNIIKYITRFKDKNGLQDIQKADDYLDLMRLGFEGGLETDMLSLREYCEANKFTEDQTSVVCLSWLYMLTGRDEYYTYAKQKIANILKELED